MTVRDYELLARSIYTTRKDEISGDSPDSFNAGLKEGEQYMRDMLIRRIAFFLGTNKKNFDRDKFLKECGL
jgi:hypothetical protein